MSKKPHIFISYRRRQSSSTPSELPERGNVGYGTQVSAHLFHWLTSNIKKIFPQGATLFYDGQDNGDILKGLYYRQIQTEMRKATHVLLILPPGALDRCYAPDDEARPHDVFGYEIRDALRKKNCTIIPIFVVENEEAIESGKNFTDASGNAITDYSMFPEKFRKEAEAANFLELQRYAVPLRRDIVAGGPEDKNLARYWNDFFCLAKILEPNNSKGALWLSLAVLALAGGLGAYWFLNPQALQVSDNDENRAQLPVGGEIKQTQISAVGKESSKKETVPEKTDKAGAVPATEPTTTPTPPASRVPAPKSEPPPAVVKKPSADVVEAFRASLTKLADEIEMGLTADEDKIREAFETLENCLEYELDSSLVNLRCGSGEQTPLHLAVIRKETALARKLLEKGAKPNISNAWGETPISLAEKNKDTAMLRLLEGL